MRALTLIQPWATLIAVGAKRVETRSWGTSYRGPVIITASAKLPFDIVLIMARPLYTQAFMDYIEKGGKPNLPTGAAVCVAELTDIAQTGVRGEDSPWVKNLSQSEREFGDYSPGRYGWIFLHVRKLKRPVPIKGARGLWTPTREQREAVEEELP